MRSVGLLPLVSTLALTLACSPITYRAEGMIEPDSFVLDAETPIREFTVRVCFEPDFDLDYGHLELEAWSEDDAYRQGEALVGFGIEEPDQWAVDEDRPAGDTMARFFGSDELERLCTTGETFTFELADPSQANGVEVQWRVRVGGRSYDEADEGSTVELSFEELE